MRKVFVPIILGVLLSFSMGVGLAEAKPMVGVGDNSPSMFKDPNYLSLNTKISRTIVGWDWYNNPFEALMLDAWITNAQAAGVEPLISFHHSMIPGRERYLPTNAEYKAMVIYFLNKYPTVTTLSPWNEANHVSQPTHNKPERAAAYYNVTSKTCKQMKKKCRIITADVLGQKNLVPWMKKFKKKAKGSNHLWGFHNYSDVNRSRKWKNTDTYKFLKLVKGEVWLTEVGGFYAFKNSFSPNSKRAAKATKKTIQIANKSKRIKRVYLYSWYGTPNHTTPPYLWDSALMEYDGTPREAFYELRKLLGIK